MATIANVIKWVSNMEEFRAEQQKGIDQLIAVQSQVDKTVRSLGGEGLIRAANNAAAAVEKLGGVSKLTAGEQERLATMTEKTLAKYQAMGQTAPSGIQRLAEATRAAVTEAKRLDDETASIQKHVNAFNGGKVVSEANQIARAVQSIGGADKLTASEQARVNAVVTEGIAKYHALGQQAPAELLKLQEATKAIPPIPDPTVAFKKGLADMQGTLNSAAAGLRTAGVGLTAGVTVPIVAAGAAVFKLGVDAVESESLVSVAFGDMRASADAWSKGLSNDLGLNQFEMRKMAGVLFTMTTGMGLGRQAAFDMSTGLSKLAADMASFRNISIEEAFNKLRSGITGETEPLKQLGILVDEATVKTYAYSTGIAKQGAELTAQQKVLARYQAILAQTKNDQGDLARTMDSPANQLRIMQTRIEEAATSLGIALLPMIQKGIGLLTSLVPVVQTVVQWFSALPAPVQYFVVALLALAAAVGPLLLLLGTMASSLASLLPLLPTLGVSSATAATGILTLRTALMGLATLGGVTIALAGIAAGIYKLIEAKQAWDKARGEGISRTEILTAKDDDNWARRWLGLTDQMTTGFEKVHTAAKDANLALEAAGPAGAKSLTPFTDALASARRELDALKKSSPAGYADALKGVQSGAFDMTALKSVTGLSEEALKLLQKEVQATKHGMTEAANEAKKLAASLDNIREAAIPLSDQQKAIALANERLTISHQDTARALGVNVNAIDTYINGVKNAEAIDADWIKTRAEMAKGVESVYQHWMDAERKQADASAVSLAKQVTDHEKYQSRVNELGLSGVRLALKNIDDARTAEIRAMGQRTDANAHFYDENRRLIDEYYAHEQRLALGTADTIVERMNRQGVLTKAQLHEVAAAAKRDYEQMKASGLYTYEQLAEAARRSAEAQRVAQSGCFSYILGQLDGLSDRFESTFSAIADHVGGAAGRIAQTISVIANAWNQAAAAADAYAKATTAAEKAAALAQGAAALAAATDPRGKTTTQNVLSGGAAGARLGAAGGPVGMAIGFGIGALVSWWRSAHAEWKKVAHDIGSDIGVDISQGLAQQIADLEKTIAGGTKEQRRKLAELLSLDAIIGEQGGLSSGNIEKFERQAAGLFEPIQRGGKLGADATKQLNTLIGQFADQAETTGGHWDATFKQLIQQSRELGLNLEAVNAAIDKQVSKLSGGLASAVKGAFAGTDAAYADLVKNLNPDQVASLTDPSKRASASPDPAIAAKALDLAKLADQAQPAFDRLNRIALASFNAIVASGKTAAEAMSGEFGASIDALIAQHDKLGLAGGAAYDQLARFRTLTKNNEDLVASVGGLNDTLVALSNLGGLNADVLADLEAQGLDTFSKLQAAGFTENEALQQMVPFLKSVIQAHVDLGTPIDENTQKLIDQANAAGLLGDDTMSMLDVLKEGFAALITAVGGQVPEAFKKMAKSAKDAASDATAAVNGIPKNVDIKVNYTDSGYHPNDPKPDPTPAPPRGPTFPGDDGRRYATGGVVLPFATGGLVPEVPAYLSTGSARVIDFAAKGTDTVPAMLTPGEIVLNEAQQKNVANGLHRGGDVTVQITIDARGADLATAQQAEQLAEQLAEKVANHPKFAAAFDRQARTNSNGIGTTIRRVA
jgi:hypothetical protein